MCVVFKCDLNSRSINCILQLSYLAFQTFNVSFPELLRFAQEYTFLNKLKAKETMLGMFFFGGGEEPFSVIEWDQELSYKLLTSAFQHS